MRLAILFENLDDKDTFGYPKVIAAYVDKSKKPEHVVYEFDDGAKVFIGGSDGPFKFKLRPPNGNIVSLYSITQNDENIRYSIGLARTFIGGWKKFTPELQAEFQQVMQVNESLDDKDTFAYEPEIDIDEYILEYWGANAASDVMLSGAREQGWVPKSPLRGEQFQDIKTQFPDLYAAAIEVARNSL